MIGGCSEFIKENTDDILMRMEQLDSSVYYTDATDMSELTNDSVDLVITSPPYPMVERWDEFGGYEEQHEMIKEVMEECWRVLREGGIMCINIGDATRSVDGRFQCYPNHSKVTTNAREIGFDSLVPIHWFKPTNKPNSFLGSGFNPPNCYVTLDTEYILIFRKGTTRSIPEDKVLWKASAFTKEERDVWFSQQWTVPGAQNVEKSQFPREIAYRLIRMFSLIRDTVLDPFAGTGTTLQMARALGRRPVGCEVDRDLKEYIDAKLAKVETISNRDVLHNLVHNEKEGVGPDLFVQNPDTLVDYL
jgi:site-specific DNA-methyltransferase (cytosine-N4-specific)